MIHPPPLRACAIGCALAAAIGLALPGTAQACTAREPTRQTWPGPHDFSTAPGENRLWRDGDAGEPLFLHLRILDTCGEPIANARVRILHADHHGAHHRDRWRAHLDADARGVLEVLTVYPGYAGEMPRHIHFIITHPGYRELVTRLFFKNDPATAGGGLDELTVVTEEVRRGEQTRWVAGFEFVLARER